MPEKTKERSVQRALILLVAVALGLYITSARFEHRFLPKSLRKLLGQDKDPR